MPIENQEERMVAKKSAKPKDKKLSTEKSTYPQAAVGRPSAYRPEFCQDLIDWMAKGNSLGSFGAYLRERYPAEKLMVHRDTVNEWTHVHAEFSDAMKVAKAASARFYDDVGRSGMTGNLRRLVSEEPVVVTGADGKPQVVVGPDGMPVMKRTYETATFGQAAYIFTRKNLHGWRDKMDVTSDGKPVDPVGAKLSAVFKDPKVAAAAKTLAERLVGKGSE
jgi:hypothetical protein